MKSESAFRSSIEVGFLCKLLKFRIGIRVGAWTRVAFSVTLFVEYNLSLNMQHVQQQGTHVSTTRFIDRHACNRA